MKLKPPTLGPVTRTTRGWPVIYFVDRSNQRCSLQVSSAADIENIMNPGVSALWLGVHDVEPKIMARDAEALGLDVSKAERDEDGKVVGWIDYAVPKEVLLASRAHLSRKQVEALIEHLQNWLDTGDLSEES